MNIQRLSDKMLKRYEDALRCGEKLTKRQNRALENHYFITHRRHPADTLRTENARLQKERNTLRELVKFEQRQKVGAGNALIKACKERGALRTENARLRDGLVEARKVIENAEHVLNFYAVKLRSGEVYPTEVYGDIGPQRFAGRVCSDLYAQLFAIRRALNPLTAESAAPTPSEKQPCPLCEGSGQYINTYGNPVFPCNACGGGGMVD